MAELNGETARCFRDVSARMDRLEKFAMAQMLIVVIGALYHQK